VFTLAVVPHRECVHVRPAGEVDLTTAGEVEATACDLLDRGFARVVIDLRAVTFLDCSGVRALVKADRHARELNRSVAIMLGASPARRILEVTRVIEHVDVESGVREPVRIRPRGGYEDTETEPNATASEDGREHQRRDRGRPGR
jgi:anti-anti-sigma factor